MVLMGVPTAGDLRVTFDLGDQSVGTGIQSGSAGKPKWFEQVRS